MPGNVVLTARETGLERDSGANVSQVVTVDRQVVRDPGGRVGPAKLQAIFRGIDVVLGR